MSSYKQPSFQTANQIQQQAQNNPIFDQFEEAKKLSGKYIKLGPGERIQLQFNVNKIQIVDSEFEGKKTGGKSIEFTVLDPREPEQERILSMSVKKADAIMALLKRGMFLLDIQKLGTGKESQFIVTPIN